MLDTKMKFCGGSSNLLGNLGNKIIATTTTTKQW